MNPADLSAAAAAITTVVIVYWRVRSQQQELGLKISQSFDQVHSQCVDLLREVKKFREGQVELEKKYAASQKEILEMRKLLAERAEANQNLQETVDLYEDFQKRILDLSNNTIAGSRVILERSKERARINSAKAYGIPDPVPVPGSPMRISPLSK